MTIKAVAFDIGGVLEHVGHPAFVERWRIRLGLSPVELNTRLGGMDPTQLIGTGGLTEPEYRCRYQRQLGLSEAQLDAFFVDMWDWYCGDLDKELADFAASLRPAYRTGIISNSADGARREEQARYDFEGLVDVVIYSHEVGCVKPDPEIYRIACQRLGVRPDELVFLDDTPDIVEAARALGVHALVHEETASSIAAVEALLATPDHPAAAPISRAAD